MVTTRVRTAVPGWTGQSAEGFERLAILVERRRIDESHRRAVFVPQQFHAHPERPLA